MSVNYFKIYLIFFNIILSNCIYAALVEQSGIFSGRVARVSEVARLVRIYINFTNMKYLNKGDKIEFWDERYQKKRCRAYIIGKSNEFILIRITDFAQCEKKVFLGNGSYLKIYSEDLLNNLKMGRELIKILEKKRIAIGGRHNRAKKIMEQHIAKVEAINDRYIVLREKLEAEWREEISAIEEDRLRIYKQFANLELQVQNIEKKMERYKIEDENLRLDRWSLDSRFYIKK